MQKMIAKMILFLIWICFTVFTSTSYAGAIPPQEFTVWNRYLGEGLVGYGYNALINLELKDSLRGKSLTESISTGEPVLEIGTAAITKPLKYPVRILSAYTTEHAYSISKDAKEVNFNKLASPLKIVIPEGETIYLLMYTGEGTYLAWYNNMIIQWIEPYHIKNFVTPYASGTPFWGEYLGDEPVLCEYWMKLQKSNGTAGWLMSEKNMLKIDRGRYKKVVD
jgi:hypothetical protein